MPYHEMPPHLAGYVPAGYMHPGYMAPPPPPAPSSTYRRGGGMKRARSLDDLPGLRIFGPPSDSEHAAQCKLHYSFLFLVSFGVLR